VGARFFAPIQTSPVTHPAFHTIGARSFLGVNWPGCRVEHPPPSSAKVKAIAELYIYTPSGPSCPVQGELYLYLYM